MTTVVAIMMAGLLGEVEGSLQPTWSLTVAGQPSLIVDLNTNPGPVSLTLTASLDTAGHTIGGWQHALIASHPDLFKYVSPVHELFGGGFFPTDVVFMTQSDGAMMNNTDELSVFAFTGDKPAFNEPVERFYIESIAELPLGTYTFDIGDSGFGHFLVNTTLAGQHGIPFGPPSGFALHITPEPSGLCLLAAGLVLFARTRRGVRAIPRR